MAQNTTETLIGGIVLAAAVGFVIFLARATGISGPADSYQLHASFRSAQGISAGTDVRMAGVKVGTVTALRLNPQTYRADVWFTVPRNIELATDTQALVSSEGLLGGNYLELVPGGAPDNLKNGDEVTDTQGAVNIVTLMMKFASGGSK